MKKLLVITGQTATGKTALAVEMAKQYKGELINFDSRQVYKKLDIVTGKDLEVVKKVPVWLYDIVDPKETFSSFQWSKHAQKVISDIIGRKKTPILVGGTYFYLKHLLDGVDTQIEPDWKLRKELDQKSVTELKSMLPKKVLESMNNSDRNNPRRLMRKIELYRSVEKKPKQRIQPLSSRYKVEIIGLRFDKEENLQKNIELRVQERLKQGAVNEVKTLLEDGYTEADPGLKTIGYKQLLKYTEGDWTLEESVQHWVINEIQYAKRQYTFMKKDSRINWKFVD